MFLCFYPLSIMSMCVCVCFAGESRWTLAAAAAAAATVAPQAAMSAKELKAAMATFEDADDVEAGRALEREAADEQMEFDDNGIASTKVFVSEEDITNSGCAFCTCMVPLIPGFRKLLMSKHGDSYYIYYIDHHRLHSLSVKSTSML